MELRKAEWPKLEHPDYKKSEAPHVDLEKKLPPTPHKLLAIPQALRASPVWQQRSPGARDLIQYLLGFSDTRTFKDVFPGTDRIERELNIDKRTRRRYEQELVSVNLIKIFPPGKSIKQPDGSYKTHTSRTIRFLFKSYMNADFKAFNKKHGTEIYKIINDLEIHQEDIYALADKIGFDLRRIQNEVDAAKIAFDNLAKRLQFDCIDELGRVRYRLHSTVFDAAMAAKVLPDNVLIFPEKKNKDVIINSRATWKTFTDGMYKKIESAERSRVMNPLIEWAESLEKAK